MKFILKTLLLAPTPKKFFEYNNKFAAVFRERDPNFDEVLNMIGDFFREYEEFPTQEVILQQAENAHSTKLGTYVTNIMTDAGVSVYTTDATFFAALETLEQELAQQDVFKAIAETQTAMATNPGKGVKGLLPGIDDLLMKVSQVRARAQRSESSTSSLLYGSQAVGSGHTLPELYDRIKKSQEDQSSVYYDLGLSHFGKSLQKDGDLVIFGAFTSHGKSILLRHAAYRQVTHYGRNVAFFSHEMSHDAKRVLFALLHANNKVIFPNTPYIPYDKWKFGLLTEEEYDFLFNVADHDLRNNPNYGTLYIDQPNKTRFRLSDMAAAVSQVETIVPIHCLVFDYLTLAYPLESDKGSPAQDDYNRMIKGFKSYLLTHRDVRGNPQPLLGYTAAQISRDGLNRAIKNEGVYDISAFHMYTELEKSADHLFTILMTNEMKATRRMRLQHHKNRDGEVVTEPTEVFVDLEQGFGLSEVQDRTDTEMREVIQNLDI